MIRAAEIGEEARLEDFLAAYPDSSMFLRSNLARHGLSRSEHPHASRYWLAEREDGAITAVLGLSREGYLMAQAPAAPAALWTRFATVLQGQDVIGMTGDATQVEAALAGLGLARAPFVTNHDEPLYRLDLVDLAAGDDQLRAPVERDLPLLGRWYADYFLDIGFVASPEQAAADAQMRARRVVAEDSCRLLLEGARPVAMAALNAQVADMVQLGGVYVPRAERNRGLGRRVTAGLLADARARSGARVAILFANNPAAARSYEAIGFRLAGRYRIAILKAAQRVGLAA